MTKTIDAIYENGVLRPLEPIDIKEHTRVRITLEVEAERQKKIEEILELAWESYEGLSEEQLSIMESARLSKTLFFPERVD